MPVVRASAKGQVVIPAALRKKIGLKAGAKVVVTLAEEGGVILRAVPTDPVEAACGFPKGGPSLIRALGRERREDRRKSSVLDSFALIAYLGRERGFESVRTLLHEAEASREPLLMNEINVGEVSLFSD